MTTLKFLRMNQFSVAGFLNLQGVRVSNGIPILLAASSDIYKTKSCVSFMTRSFTLTRTCLFSCVTSITEFKDTVGLAAVSSASDFSIQFGNTVLLELKEQHIAPSTDHQEIKKKKKVQFIITCNRLLGQWPIISIFNVPMCS